MYYVWPSCWQRRDSLRCSLGIYLLGEGVGGHATPDPFSLFWVLLCAAAHPRLVSRAHRGGIARAASLHEFAPETGGGRPTQQDSISGLDIRVHRPGGGGGGARVAGVHRWAAPHVWGVAGASALIMVLWLCLSAALCLCLLLNLLDVHHHLHEDLLRPGRLVLQFGVK